MQQGAGFTWRGSAGAECYTLERAASKRGPFVVLATGLHDAVIADVATFEPKPEASRPQILFTDESAVAGNTYFYRIKAVNAAGVSAYSPVVPAKR
jgi:hypothetical protein